MAPAEKWRPLVLAVVGGSWLVSVGLELDSVGLSKIYCDLARLVGPCLDWAKSGGICQDSVVLGLIFVRTLCKVVELDAIW